MIYLGGVPIVARLEPVPYAYSVWESKSFGLNVGLANEFCWYVLRWELIVGGLL